MKYYIVQYNPIPASGAPVLYSHSNDYKTEDINQATIFTELEEAAKFKHSSLGMSEPDDYEWGEVVEVARSTIIVNIPQTERSTQ